MPDALSVFTLSIQSVC